MKKQCRILLVMLLLAALLAGCAVSTATGAMRDNKAERYETAQATASAPEEASDTLGYAVEDDYSEDSAPAANEVPSVQTGDKMIYSAYLSIESTEFDETIASLEKLIEEAGGYIQSSSVNGSTCNNPDGTTTVVDRYANYTVAVPQPEFEQILSRSNAIGNVTTLERYAENITSQYTDTEARMQSLQVQEERLLAMMEQAQQVEDLIALEQRLSEVTYERESYQRTLEDWDRQIAYSTIDLQIQEVAVYTPLAASTRSFSQKLQDAVGDGWSRFVSGLQGLLLGIVSILPVLLLLAAAAVVTVLLVHRAKKKRCAAGADPKAKDKRADENPADHTPQ